MARKLLLVEDDVVLGEALERELQGEGFQVVRASDGEQGLELASAADVSLIILDLTLPKLDGFQLLTGLRRRGVATPVLVLSAKSHELDKVMALDLGADDYLTKPFSTAELLARLRALERRTGVRPRLALGRGEVDFERRLAWVEGKPVELSPTAWGVLLALTRAAGAVVSRDELFALVRPHRRFGSRRLADNAILELRRLFEREPSQPRHFLSVRGLGYRLVLGDDDRE